MAEIAITDTTATATSSYYHYSDVKPIIFDLLVGAADGNFHTLACIKCSLFSGVDSNECEKCMKCTCKECKEGDDGQAKCSGC